MFKKNSIFVLVLTVIIITFMMGSTSIASEAEYTIKFCHGAEVTEPTHKAALCLAHRVEERTNGQVHIDVYPSAQLGSERELIESIKLGAIEMVFISSGGCGYLQKELEIFNGPFLFNNWEEAKKVLRGPIAQELYDKMLENYGVRVLDPCWYWGWRHLTTNVKVETPDDLSGLAIRAPNLEVYVETVRYMGANPTPLNFAEVYTALQTGVVDGQENPIPTIWGKKFYEVQDYVILTGHQLQSNFVIINEEFFSSLPDIFQNVIKEEVIACGEYVSRFQQQQEEELLSKIRETGTEIVEVDREIFRKATEPVYHKLSDKWGEELYEDIVKQLQELRSN